MLRFVQFATEGTKLYLHAMKDASPLRALSVEIHFGVPDVDAAAEVEQGPQNLVGPLKSGEPTAEH